MADISRGKTPIRPSWKSPWSVSFGLLILVAIFDFSNLGAVTLFAVNAFVSTLKYIVFAVFLIAALKAAGAEAVIANAFKGREVRMIFVAAFFGGFLLRFFARFGAFATPLKPSFSQGCGCGPSPLTGKPHWRFWQVPARRQTFKREFISNALFLAKWLAMAYVLEALLVNYMPSDLIVKLVGGEGLLPIVTAALVGMPAYLNSYVAPPLLAGLTEQGMSAGAAMPFMIAGAVSSVLAMAAVWSLVHPQIFALYLVLGVSGAIMAGVIFQQVI